MSIHSVFYFLLATIVLTACNNGKPMRIAEIPTDFLKSDSTIRNSDLFLIGPAIDSAKAEVAAGCDCCASKLALLNDSSFMYKVICLGGDSYVKGNYVSFGNLLILHTDEEVISSEYEYATENLGDAPINYEVTEQKRDFHAYEISRLKGKTFITYTSKEDFKEYGMPDTEPLNDFLAEFREEKVLKRFLEAE